MFGIATAAVTENPIGEPLYRCISQGNASYYAYFVMVGPISDERKYSKWLYPILALRHALSRLGSSADVVVLAAVDECCASTRMLAAEEALLASQSVRVRYVPAPAGIRGFHMGHYKLWAWQHTEYKRIQVLDADVLPLVNMDPLFELPLRSDFVGCPGRASVLNAGWFSLRPDCDHFKSLVTVLFDKATRPDHRFDDILGWGVPLPPWTNALGKLMPEGYDFFDAKGNQGHMYAYFRFYANDLTLVFADAVQAFKGRRPVRPPYRLNADNVRLDVLASRDDVHGDDLMKRKLASAIYRAFPCPFAPVKGDIDVAYHHFTGNVKPWTRYDPGNARFKQWYAVLADIGIDVQKTIFNESSTEVHNPFFDHHSGHKRESSSRGFFRRWTSRPPQR